ncbi:MAG: proline--tRNA ligase [Actinobacteria bacterium]|nr:MAG: proline--tRNA ligase [Actinomycetota bacterium]
MPRAPILTPRADDFPRWYQDVVAKAELADNGPVRGTMVIRPYGYAIWERIQQGLDARIKAAGAQNVYFPLMIPESYVHREAEHVEGFSPELAVVTHGGGRKLEEPAVLRPSSETVIAGYFAKWVQSYRDLPLLVNQWANVVRWELRPRLFLRTTEFLWQEGHTVHESEQDARRYALRILDEVYRDFMVEVLAVPVLMGRKTERERFAGATTTWTCEAMMSDGKALQMGTSHELGQNFSRAFGIEFQSETGESVHGWQTSWGASTRLVGGLVMAHGDDDGLRLPPRLAPIQVVVVLVRDENGTGPAAERLTSELASAGHRVELDAATDTSYGRRVTDWELKGVPVRIEIGPRDLAAGTVSLIRRDNGYRADIALDRVVVSVNAALEEAQAAMLADAEAQREQRTADVSSVAEAIEATKVGFARLSWGRLGTDGEAELAAAGVSVRCLLAADGGLPRPGGSAHDLAVVGRAY